MFGIKSIPTVMLVSQGQVVDGFAGALPEGQLREFLSRHVQPLEGEPSRRRCRRCRGRNARGGDQSHPAGNRRRAGQGRAQARPGAGADVPARPMPPAPNSMRCRPTSPPTRARSACAANSNWPTPPRPRPK
ncbi:thioredoxin family protein [Rhodanobacter lindaniclasticus]